MITRLRHIGLAVKILPRILLDRSQRMLFQEMRTFIRQLPRALKAPVPQAIQAITPVTAQSIGAERTTRELADVVALLDRASPLGLCLRRSLTRYHFLRRAGVPVAIHFGAKLIGGRPDRSITGHAWLSLDRRAYFEDDENHQGFVVMLTFPASEIKKEIS